MRRRWAFVVLAVLGCTEPESNNSPAGIFALLSMNGKSVPVALTGGDSLISGWAVLRTDSMFGITPKYRGGPNGAFGGYVNGRYSLSGSDITYYTTGNVIIATGVYSSSGVTFVQNSDNSSFTFGRGVTADEAILDDRGSYTITVSGTLSGTTAVSDTGHAFLGDYVAINSQGLVVGGKSSSSFGPGDGADRLVLQFNSDLTIPGTYHNNDCAFQVSFGTKCVAITLYVSQPPGGSNRGTLQAIADNGETVVVQALSPWHVKLTISGPWEWLPPMPAGVAQKYDTVTVSASFNALRVR